MIKLIVGLGNPGQQYEKTRHNAGFLFLDWLLASCGGVWVSESRFRGVLASCRFGAHKVVLLKPQTYMNKSGESVGKVARYYKFKPEEILVVHDELDFDEGVVRVKQGGGHAGHNGLRDIISHLGSKDFLRLRVGVGRPSSAASKVNYVLSKPSQAGMLQIEASYAEFERVIKTVVEGDANKIANLLHG